MKNQIVIDIKSPDVLPKKDKVTPENFLSDHRPVFANVAIDNESPLRVMSWNVQGGNGCYGRIYDSIIKKLSTFLIKNPQLELSVEEKSMAELFLKENIGQDISEEKVRTFIEDYYYSQRMRKQASLLPKDELDVIFLQEATPETVQAYLDALGEAWTPIHEPLAKDSNLNVTFIRKERFAMTKADGEKYTVSEKYEGFNNKRFKYCQSMVLKTQQGNLIELVNCWGNIPKYDLFDNIDVNDEQNLLNRFEELMRSPLQEGSVKRILGGDTNLRLGKELDDEITCIGFDKPSQCDVILSFTENGPIENETLIKSSYQRAIHNEMCSAISQQISRIQETQTWFWRFFYADGAAKIEVLEKLRGCILSSPTKEELGDNIQMFLSSPFSSTELKITNSEILKARRFWGKSEADQVIQEIQRQANHFKK